jgi:hypothetical protein
MEESCPDFWQPSAADEDDAREDVRILPAERIQIVIELRNRLYPDAAQQRFARVVELLNSNKGNAARMSGRATN